MITVINTFIVPDEAMDPFIAEFELHRDFLARQPGFVRGSLYRKANGPGVFNVINLAVWQSEDELQAARAKMGALYAAADMNSLQWVQGRPAPILTDTLDGVDIVRLLLQKGADPDARLRTRPLKRHHDAGSTLNLGEGTTPLMRAARTGDTAVIKALLDAGANPFLTLPDGTNALLLAAGQGYGGVRGDGIRIVVPTPDDAAGAVQLLLDRGVDVDSFNTAGNTALHAAVNRGDAVVRILASRKARLIKNKAGVTPLEVAQGAGGRGGRGRGGAPREPRESTLAIFRQHYPGAFATAKAN